MKKIISVKFSQNFPKEKWKKPQDDNYAHSLNGSTQNISDSCEFLIYISAL